MQLIPIESRFIDAAWRDGASALAKACDTSGGEITGDQLKMILARGERTLIRMDDTVDCEQKKLPDGTYANFETHTVGWGVVRIDQLPNLRVLFITDLVAPHGHFERFFAAIKAMAVSQGCSRVRCAAKPAQERLYRIKCGFQPVYSILEVEA